MFPAHVTQCSVELLDCSSHSQWFPCRLIVIVLGLDGSTIAHINPCLIQLLLTSRGSDTVSHACRSSRVSTKAGMQLSRGDHH